ncbi:MAG TPA: PRC-barrel domain-containing protein [Aestuariivirgaceae bacterium]|nr:PRC-barrel domain-containing protein [Aestuariivirgaceae bacterium]
MSQTTKAAMRVFAIALSIALPITLLGTSGNANATEKCDIADSELEEAIAKKPEFRAAANRQLVRDLRSLRDAAFILWSYGRLEDCNRLMANIRELVFAPAMGSLGGTDEDEVNYQTAASEPFVHRGGAVEGRRGDVGAKALISIDELVPGLRADEIIGTEVRSSDDKIIGEVRNFVFGTKDRRDYAVVASGGFFTIGTDSFVVPIRYLSVNQDRDSFYLQITEAAAKSVPLMPDHDYAWHADEEWLAVNDAHFE